MCIRRFHFDRIKDVSGVSGCGKVAEGCLFVDTGEVVVKWSGSHSSINIYKNLEDLEFVHGHHGATAVIFLDPEPNDKKDEVKKDGNTSN